MLHLKLKKILFFFFPFLLSAAQTVWFIPSSSSDLDGKFLELPKNSSPENYPTYPLTNFLLGKSHFTAKAGSLTSLKKERMKNISCVIFQNLPHYETIKNISIIPFKKRVVFLWEPPSVEPEMYRKSTYNLFSRVYTWDDDLVDNKTFFKFHYPVLKPIISDIVSFSTKKLCTGIFSCKNSLHDSELYTEREKAFRFFEKNTDNFEFYGMGWEQKGFASYKGSVEDKIATLKNYKFSICYENMDNIRGYVTEKIFDSFAAGCVPIYLGAVNIEDYVPSNCFIDKRKFSSYEKLLSYLQNMKEETYDNYLKNIKFFLKSKEANLFSPECFAQLIVSVASELKD